MLHVVDNLLPGDLLEALQQLCLIHGELKQAHTGEALFSWRAEDGGSRSIHAPQQRQLIERYLKEHLLPLSAPFCPQWAGVEWWCNVNNDLDWHIDKDELKGGAAAPRSCRCCPRSSTPMSAAPGVSCSWWTTNPLPQAIPVRCRSSAR